MPDKPKIKMLPLPHTAVVTERSIYLPLKEPRHVIYLVRTGAPVLAGALVYVVITPFLAVTPWVYPIPLFIIMWAVIWSSITTAKKRENLKKEYPLQRIRELWEQITH